MPIPSFAHDNKEKSKEEQKEPYSFSFDFDKMAESFFLEQNKTASSSSSLASSGASPKIHLEDLLQKKKKILDKVSFNLEEKGRKIKIYFEAGQYLSRILGLEEVDSKWKKYIHADESLFWNRENLFSIYKKEKKKKEAILNRIVALQKEMEDIRKNPDLFLKREHFKKDYLEKRTEKETYLALTDTVMAFMGASAKKNLELLRKAKPWHLWLHAKDFPGPHVLISCPRGGRGMSEQLIFQVAKWLCLAQFKKNPPPPKVHFILAECRYVRPIKGDKLGRVSYQNHRTLIYKI